MSGNDKHVTQIIQSWARLIENRMERLRSEIDWEFRYQLLCQFEHATQSLMGRNFCVSVDPDTPADIRAIARRMSSAIAAVVQDEYDVHCLLEERKYKPWPNPDQWRLVVEISKPNCLDPGKRLRSTLVFGSSEIESESPIPLAVRMTKKAVKALRQHERDGTPNTPVSH